MKKMLLVCLLAFLSLGSFCQRGTTIDLLAFDKVIVQEIEKKANECLESESNMSDWEDCMFEHMKLVDLLVLVLRDGMQSDDIKALVDLAESLGIEIPEVEK